MNARNQNPHQTVTYVRQMLQESVPQRTVGLCNVKHAPWSTATTLPPCPPAELPYIRLSPSKLMELFTIICIEPADRRRTIQWWGVFKHARRHESGWALDGKHLYSQRWRRASCLTISRCNVSRSHSQTTARQYLHSAVYTWRE